MSCPCESTGMLFGGDSVGGLELYRSEGLPYGNDALSSKGLLIFAEKATRSALI